MNFLAVSTNTLDLYIATQSFLLQPLNIQSKHFFEPLKKVSTPVALCSKVNSYVYTISNLFYVIWFTLARDTAPHFPEHPTLWAFNSMYISGQSSFKKKSVPKYKASVVKPFQY